MGCPMSCHISPVALCDLPFCVVRPRKSTHCLLVLGFTLMNVGPEVKGEHQCYSSLTSASIWFVFLTLSCDECCV